MTLLKHCGCRRPACGCCAGTEATTPRPRVNGPGLDALAYRVGTHGSFLQSMKARLAQHRLTADDKPGPLAALRTRSASDPAMAMLDAWALVGDVLSFYQERIANEGFLRTAGEMRSLHEMARLVGYRPRPGVAASVYLAYTVDAHTVGPVLVPRGSRAQTVPGPGELPQTFETDEDLQARAAWTRLGPRRTLPQSLQTIGSQLLLRGASPGVKPGDPLLLVEGNTRHLVTVVAVSPVPGGEPGQEQTRVEITPVPAPAAPAPAALLRIADVLARKPAGAVAQRVAERVDAGLRGAVELSRPDAAALLGHIDTETRSLGALPAPRLRPWLQELRDAIAAAPAARAQAQAQQPDDKVAGLLRGMTRRPSRPLPSALQLPRHIDFAPTGDASLQLTAAAAPALRGALGAALGGLAGGAEPATLEVYAFRVRSGVFGRNAPKRQFQLRAKDGNDETTQALPIGEWPIIETSAEDPEHGEITKYTEWEQAVHLETAVDGILPGSWVVIDTSAIEPVKDAGGQPMVFPAEPDRPLVTRVASVQPRLARAEYGISGDTTRLALEQAWLKFKPRTQTSGDLHDGQSTHPVIVRTQQIIDLDFRVVRRTAIYARSERLELAERPIEEPLCGTHEATGDALPLELDGLYDELQPGRLVVVEGLRADLGAGTALPAAEPLMITRVVHDVRSAGRALPWSDAPAGDEPLAGDRLHTFVWFDEPLRYCYARDSVVVHGNVVRASHGETRREVLGGGDGARALQHFELKQAPLTHVAAATPEGAQSTLRVFVNDVRWHERDAFIDARPDERMYLTKLDPDGRATVVFGNGREGARLPTGLDNVQAEYRFGIGRGGNARAGQISQLGTRPLGIKEVVNPVRASGGADADSLEQLRRNLPTAVRALGRLVATSDYADFARSFAGVGKAAAVALSDGRRRLVHLTIAGVDDEPIETDSALYLQLGRALRELGDPFQPVEVAVRDLRVLVIAAGIRIDADRRWEVVVTQLRQRLVERLGFERRELAQGLAASEVLALMQAVPGVAYVDLDVFGALPTLRVDPLAEGGLRPLTPQEIAGDVAVVLGQEPRAGTASRIAVLPARAAGGGVLPAQIAVLRADVPATLVLNQIR